MTLKSGHAETPTVGRDTASVPIHSAHGARVIEVEHGGIRMDEVAQNDS